MARITKAGLLVAGGIAALLMVVPRRPSHAQFVIGMGRTSLPDDMRGYGEPGNPTPRVYVARPVSDQEARTWMKLNQPISMPFRNDTPFADALQYIRQATADEDLPDGIPIYVDPVGLQEAEQTMQSPITMELEGIPLSTTLTLLLKQLGLAFEVQKDGILIITDELVGRDAPIDPTMQVLDELRELREEVAALHEQMRAAGCCGGGSACGCSRDQEQEAVGVPAPAFQ